MGCPLIEDSNKLDFSSTAKLFNYLIKNLIKKLDYSWCLDQDEKEKVLKEFLNNKISILVSTTVLKLV